jgi:hypothetical protein
MYLSQNIGNKLRIDTASYLRRTESSHSVLVKDIKRLIMHKKKMLFLLTIILNLKINVCCYNVKLFKYVECVLFNFHATFKE